MTRRATLWVISILTLTAATFGIVQVSHADVDQCSIPVAERTGGWVCP